MLELLNKYIGTMVVDTNITGVGQLAGNEALVMKEVPVNNRCAKLILLFHSI